MCGIAGLINVKDENKELAKRMFKSILLANEVRGRDSTGIVAIDRESNEFSLFKDTIPSSVFLNRKKFRQVEADIWIGHTRLATTGEVNIRNAHPLQRKDIFLVHNGMISNHVEIGKSLDLEYQVDSEVLIPIVENEDWDLLQDVKGTFNFIAWDRTKGKVYVERHDNPLYCLTLKKLDIVMFSSVKDVLEFLAGHYGEGEEVYEFTPDTMVELDMKGNTIGTIKKLKFKEDIYLPSTKIEYPKQTRTRTYRPSYYHEWEEYEDYDDYMAMYENNKEQYCEGCEFSITKEEADIGIAEWGFPLCERCLEELQEANDIISSGKLIDPYSPKWEKFTHILVNFLP